MKFTVAWIPQAERELAEIWTRAEDRRAISRAANEIDTTLRVDPLNAGESRALGTRMLFMRPLGVTFSADDQDRIVRILRVWRFDKPASR